MSRTGDRAVEVRLDLSAHCVGTAARGEHRRLVALLLCDDGEHPGLEARAALVRDFLQEADFPALRARHPDLAGGRPVQVTLFRGEDGTPRWRRA